MVQYKLTKDSNEIQYPIPEQDHVKLTYTLAFFQLGESYKYGQCEEAAFEQEAGEQSISSLIAG